MVSTSLKNISQLGLLFPIYRKMKKNPNHQADIYSITPPSVGFPHPSPFAASRRSARPRAAPRSWSGSPPQPPRTRRSPGSTATCGNGATATGKGKGGWGWRRWIWYIYNINKETWWESIEFYVYEDGYMVGWSNVNKKIDVEKYMYIYV